MLSLMRSAAECQTGFSDRLGEQAMRGSWIIPCADSYRNARNALRIRSKIFTVSETLDGTGFRGCGDKEHVLVEFDRHAMPSPPGAFM